MTAQTKHQVKVVKKNKDMNQLSATSNVILNIVFILAVIITVAPIWVIIMASFTSEKALQTYGYGFWPNALRRNGPPMLTPSCSLRVPSSAPLTRTPSLRPSWAPYFA